MCGQKDDKDEGGEAMETIALHLDPQTLARARQFAALRHRTLEELLTESIVFLGMAEAQHDPFLGMCADEPTLMDQVVASAMHARTEHPLRTCSG
jgi:hypothetical protein